MKVTEKYQDLSENIVQLVGGMDNIVFFTHCVTRLRFNIKDKSLVNIDEISKQKNIIGVQWSGEQLQIIIGQEVSDVYKLISEKYNFENKETEKIKSNNIKKERFSFNKLISDISGCITPLIPMMIGGGMIKILVLLLSQTNILSADSPSLITLTFVADASLYFLPVAIGYTGAIKFGVNPGLGMLLGGILIHPTFIAMVTENADGGSIFGIPIAAKTYTNSIFPMIITMFVAGYVERFFAKYSPKAIRSIVQPLGTLLIMVPFMLGILAPLGSYAGVYLASGIMWLYATVGPVGSALFAAFSPYLVITGMHLLLDPYTTQSLATYGKESIIGPAKFVRDFNQGISCLVVALKTKDADLKATCIACAVTAIFGGVTEPALFGVNLKCKKAMLSTIIGGLCGGFYAGLMHTARYSYGPGGVFGLSVFISSDPMNLINQIIAILIGCVVTFIVGMIIIKEEDIKKSFNL